MSDIRLTVTPRDLTRVAHNPVVVGSSPTRPTFNLRNIEEKMLTNWKVRYAKILIVLLFAIMTMLQIFSFPGQFAHLRRMGSIELLFEIWFTLLLSFWLFTAQFALFCLWKIVAQITSGSIYNKSSLQWLDKLVHAFKYSLITALTVFLSIAVQADDPGAPVMLVALTLFISTLFVATSLLRDQLRSKSD